LKANDGIIGIFEPDQEPITFLSTSSVDKSYVDVKYQKDANVGYPYLGIFI